MFKWLLLGGIVLGIGDPYLLYLIYDAYGWWPAAGVVGVPIVLGTLMLPLAKRSLAVPPTDFSQMPIRIVEMFLIPASNMMLWFPGPVTSLLGLALLVGPLRRMAARIVIRNAGVGGNVFSSMNGLGGLGGMGGMGPMSGGVSFGGGMPASRAPNAAPGNLKRAEGKVIDVDPPALPDSGKKDKPR